MQTILDYVAWIGLAVSAACVVWLGVLIAVSLRRGEGAANVGRLGLVLGGVALIGASGALVAGLIPAGPTASVSGATLFLQSALWYYMGALAVVSVIVAGVRMAWEARSEPGKDLLRSLLTLVVVAGAGVTITQLALTASDQFSVWILQGALNCDVSADGACFSDSLMGLFTAAAAGGQPAVMVTIILGLFAGLAAILQVLLMLARAGIVVILAGVLPLSAAATNTESGRSWFRKTVGWLIAWVLYKPAAAIVYAAGFSLIANGNVFGSGDEIVTVLTGLMVLLLALIALPVLLRLVTPAVAPVAGGAGMGGAMAGAGIAALPMGAVAASRMGGGVQPPTPASGAADSSGPATSAGPDGGAGPTSGGGGPAEVDLRDPRTTGAASKAGHGAGAAGGSAAGGGGGAGGGGSAGSTAGAGVAAPVLAVGQAAGQARDAAVEQAGRAAAAAVGEPQGSTGTQSGGGWAGMPQGGQSPVGAGAATAGADGQPTGGGQGVAAGGAAGGLSPDGAGGSHGVSGGQPTGGGPYPTGGGAGGGLADAARTVGVVAAQVVQGAPAAVAGDDGQGGGPSGSS